MQLDLGNRIRQLRRRDGRTQEILADALGVTPQAVSRWEAGGSYPDMNLIPSIANYFGVTIDELFGYQNAREDRIRGVVTDLRKLRIENNGTDVNLDQAVASARSALLEFPGNEHIMLCLADILYTAGYVRRGERHLTDADGYDIYDTALHSGYPEWVEAVTLYEKVLGTLPDGDLRREAVGELIQLYVNMGQHEKALALADGAPDIYGTREYMRICACDGKARLVAQGEAILKMIHASAMLMVQGVLTAKQTMTDSQKTQSIRGAIALFDQICTDGNYGEHNRAIARMYTLLSLYLWQEGKHDEAFSALDRALAHFQQFERLCKQEGGYYTAPLFRFVPVDISSDPQAESDTAVSLYEDWPWWQVPEAETVKEQMRQDPRWQVWVRECSRN